MFWSRIQSHLSSHSIFSRSLSNLAQTSFRPGAHYCHTLRLSRRVMRLLYDSIASRPFLIGRRIYQSADLLFARHILSLSVLRFPSVPAELAHSTRVTKVTPSRTGRTTTWTRGSQRTCSLNSRIASALDELISSDLCDGKDAFHGAPFFEEGVPINTKERSRYQLQVHARQRVYQKRARTL